MEAKINISTKQYDENNNTDTMKVNAVGKIFEKNNDIYVVYEEIEDGEKITNTIKISDKKFLLRNLEMLIH